MASTIEELYGTNGVSITITLASLTNNSARESNSVDNTTNLFLDALVMLKIKTGAGALAGDQVVDIYAAGTVDNGTSWPDTVTGSDAAITLNSPTQLKLIGSIQVSATATTYKSEPLSVAGAFNGILPAKWSIIVVNRTGATLDATGGNFLLQYQGIQAQGT